MCADGKYRLTPGIEPGQLTHSVDYPIAGVCVYQLRHIDPVIPKLELIFIHHTQIFSRFILAKISQVLFCDKQ